MAQEETDFYTLWPQQWMFDYQSSKAVKIQHDDWFIDYDHCPNVLDPNSGSWRHVPKSLDWQSWLQTWLLMLLLHSWVNYQEWGNSVSQEIVDLWTWKHGSAVKEWCCACDHCCDCLKGVTSTVTCNLIGLETLLTMWSIWFINVLGPIEGLNELIPVQLAMYIDDGNHICECAASNCCARCHLGTELLWQWMPIPEIALAMNANSRYRQVASQKFGLEPPCLRKKPQDPCVTGD